MQKYPFTFILICTPFLVGIGSTLLISDNRVAEAVVDSGNGQCADSAQNVVFLNDMRSRLAAATTYEEVQGINNEFQQLETHDGRHIVEAANQTDLEITRNRILAKITRAREEDDEAAYTEELSELEGRAEEAEDFEELLAIEDRVDDIRFVIKPQNIAVTESTPPLAEPELESATTTPETATSTPETATSTPESATSTPSEETTTP